MFVYAVMRIRAVVDNRVLIVDYRRSTLTLPKMLGRKAPMVVPLGDIVAFWVVPRADNRWDRTVYVPMVRWQDTYAGAARDEELAEYADEEQAQALADGIKKLTNPTSLTG